MASFGHSSTVRLATIHPDLRAVMNEAIKTYDFSIVCGYRGQAQQNKAYDDGFSKLQYPESNHNENPSRAVDIIPYPSGYQVEDEFFFMATHVLAAASKLKIPLTWGGHWRTFRDLPHFQLSGIT